MQEYYSQIISGINEFKDSPVKDKILKFIEDSPIKLVEIDQIELKRET
jgi:hypothetical protein